VPSLSIDSAETWVSEVTEELVVTDIRVRSPAAIQPNHRRAVSVPMALAAVNNCTLEGMTAAEAVARVLDDMPESG